MEKETNDKVVTASELERSIPIVDFCAAYGIPFLKQRGATAITISLMQTLTK